MDMGIMGYNYIDFFNGITNPNKYCGTYCKRLGISVSFL